MFPALAFEDDIVLLNNTDITGTLNAKLHQYTWRTEWTGLFFESQNFNSEAIRPQKRLQPAEVTGHNMQNSLNQERELWFGICSLSLY